MIELTKLNGKSIILNSDLIKTAEASPDTMLTLINGEKLIVRENREEIVQSIIDYRAQLLAAVARKLPYLTDVQQIASLSSLNMSDQIPPG